MGIFFDDEKKETCSICGEKFISCYKLKDKSKICKNCIKKIGGFWTTNWVNMTQEQAIEAIKDNETITCPICNKNKIRRKDKVCNSCKTYLVENLRLEQESFNRIFGDISKGYKKIEPYLSRYKILIETMENAYKEVEYIPDIVHLSPSNFEEFKEDLLENNLKTVILEKKAVVLNAYAQTGEVSHFRAIKKLRDEILEMQVKYPEFIEYLTIDDLQDIIEGVERR